MFKNYETATAAISEARLRGCILYVTLPSDEMDHLVELADFALLGGEVVEALGSEEDSWCVIAEIVR